MVRRVKKALEVGTAAGRVADTAGEAKFGVRAADYAEENILPWLQETAQSDTVGGKILRGLGWVGEQHSKIPGYDWLEGRLINAGATVANIGGIDPRIGMLVGAIIMPDLTDIAPGIGSALGASAVKAGKASRKTFIKGQKAIDAVNKGSNLGVHRKATKADVILALTPTHKMGPGFELPRLPNPVARISDDPLKRSSKLTESPYGQITSKIDNRTVATGLTDSSYIKSFNAAYNDITSETMGSPHHILDHELMGAAMNRVDGQEILDQLQGRWGMHGGDFDSNLIMQYHWVNGKHRRQIGKGMIEQMVGKKKWESLTKEGQDRLITDLMKSAKEQAASVEGIKVPGEFVTDLKAPKAKGPDSYQNFWNRLKENGIDPKKLKADPDGIIAGTDHMMLTHGLYNMIPQRQAILKMIADGDWYSLHPVEAASRLAEVGRIQQNIVINVSARRLKLVKNRMREAFKKAGKLPNGKNAVSLKQINEYINDPKIVQAWMYDNPHLAAAAGWKDTAIKSKNLANIYEEMTDGTAAINNATDELRMVFKTKITPELLKRGTKAEL